ncbi:MAG: 2-amino-3,7-dideoxy-D-threo-hept-6-ulosonate synthase [Bacteriovorax sp.]|nr:2-amino-3,7-dideoxy-D-threo-hept-6-ulosonate synthase [Bacteriovorax sp.]
MSEIGKAIRMQRIFNRVTGKTIIAPMDHGVSMGPIPGLTKMKEAVDRVAQGGANAVVVQKGVVKQGYRNGGKDVGLFIHLSASTGLSHDPNYKTLVCTVEEALMLGADAVSIQVNIGNGGESKMLRDLGEVTRKANEWGKPLMAMIYPRGEKIKNPYDVEFVKHAARIGYELGADIVKVPYTGSIETFQEVVEGCEIPVVIAGGEKMETDRELLEVVYGAMKAGAAGLSIGRNIFQHEDPVLIVKAMYAIVHENLGVEDALRCLEK